MPALQIRDLTIGHGHGHQTDDGLWLGVLIQNLTITINSGQLVWVSGENGIGKTTFCAPWPVCISHGLENLFGWMKP